LDGARVIVKRPTDANREADTGIEEARAIALDPSQLGGRTIRDADD
jgi:hypothetical protein